MTTQQDPTQDDIVKALGWDDGDVDDPSDNEPAPAQAIGTEGAPSAPQVDVAPQIPPAPQVAPTPDYQEVFREQQAVQQRQATEQSVKNNINVEANAHYNDLVTKGLDEASASDSARKYANGEWSRYQFEQADQMNRNMSKHTAAQEYATKYNVPVQELLAYSTPEAMEAAGARRQQENTRLASLEQQVKAVQLAPVQEFDSGAGGGATSDAAKKLAYSTGTGDLTTEEYNRLFPRT